MFKSLKSVLFDTWKFFTSIRLAIILILILVGLGLIGTLVIQVPASYTINLDLYNYWLQNVAQPQTGFWYPILNFGDLFNVFHSPWFLGTGILLIINILVCTVNRWRHTRSAMSRSRVINHEEFYGSANKNIDQSLFQTNTEPSGILTRILRKHRYQIRTERTPDTIYIAGDKNRFSPLGTYLIHLSLILFIAGYLIGNAFGFRDMSFIVPEQSTREIGYSTGLSLHLNSFAANFWPDGSPKDYTSDVVLYKNGNKVKTGTIRVNHPLTYNGINIYQSFFGPAVQLQITDSNGNTLYTGDIALNEIIPSPQYTRPTGEITLPQNGYQVFITGRSTNTSDSVLNTDQIELDIFDNSATTPLISTTLTQGVPYQGQGLDVTYLGDAMFSGFEVSKTPGTNIIWTASVLLLLGLFTVFYFPRRRIWAIIRNDTANGQILRIRTGSGNKFGVAAELNRIAKEINETCESS